MRCKTIVCLAVLLAVTIGGCERQKASAVPNASPPTVTVTSVTERDINTVVENVGRMEAVASVDLRSQVTGVLKSRAFEEGEIVEQGDLLYEIEPASFEAELAVQAAAVANAKAANERAASYLARIRNMRVGAVSSIEIETAIADEAQAKAALQQSRAQWRAARLDLDYTKIFAPIRGRIGTSTVDPGDLVAAEADTLTTIVQLNPIYVTWSVSERVRTALASDLLAKGARTDVRDGLVARVRLSNGQEYPFDGNLVFVDNEVDTETGTVQIRAELSNPDELLLPGQFVTTLVRAKDANRRKLIPQAAVQQDQAGHFVLVVDDDDQVERRWVELGARVATQWIVEGGLEAGEFVIYQGLEKATAGSKVAATVLAPEDSTSSIATEKLSELTAERARGG